MYSNRGPSFLPFTLTCTALLYNNLWSLKLASLTLLHRVRVHVRVRLRLRLRARVRVRVHMRAQTC